MKHDSIDEDGNLCLIDRVDDECLVHMLQAATKCRPQEVRRSRYAAEGSQSRCLQSGGEVVAEECEL